MTMVSSYIDRHSPRSWLWILACSFVLRLALSASVPVSITPENSDGLTYHGLALRMLEGRGYVAESGRPTACFPPGYPAFLALLYGLTGCSWRAALLANAVLATVMAGLIGLTAWLWMPRMARPTFLMASAWPASYAFCVVPNAEVLYTVLLLGSLILLFPGRVDTPWRSIPLAGALLGLSALVRGQSLLLPVIVAVIWWRHRSASWTRPCLMAALLGASFFAPLAPWLARNGRILGGCELATNRGYNFLIGNNPRANGGFLTLTREELASTAKDEVAIDREYWQRGWEYARQNPWHELGLIAAKAFLTLRADPTYTFRGFLGNWLGPWSYPLLGYAFLYHLLVLPLALLGFWRGRHHHWQQISSVLAVYFVLIQCAFFGGVRYLFPAEPFLIILAALGWGSLIDRPAPIREALENSRAPRRPR